MQFFFFLILFYHTTLALIYNDKCTKKCDLPGLVCVDNRCICDSKTRLFWTNARCAPCPNDWTMTETACIAYYETVMPWENARLTCREVKAELISFRHRDLISLIYTATNKKISPGKMDKLSAWTSAHATDYSGLGVYQWLDKNVPSFNSKSDWWCKKTTADLGYAYPYDEPTRHTDKNNETEACVLYWRGTTTTEVVCLDDQLCSQEFPFVCEKSESTANKYLGPPPVAMNLLNTTSNVRATVIHTIPGNVGTIIINTANRAPKSEKKSIGTIVVILIVVLLFLLVLLGGLFFFLKRHNAMKTLFSYNRTTTSRVASPVSKKSNASANEPIIKDELVHPDTNTSDLGLVLESDTVPVNTGIRIDSQKQQKTKRGGYSKQQFDEFE